MISAGIEGGSKSAIEEGWNLDDVYMMRSYWKRNGPPVHVSVVAVAASLGVDLLREDEAETDEQTLDPASPLSKISIAELSAKVRRPVDSHDTMETSRQIQRILQGEEKV